MPSKWEEHNKSVEDWDEDGRVASKWQRRWSEIEGCEGLSGKGEWHKSQHWQHKNTAHFGPSRKGNWTDLASFEQHPVPDPLRLSSSSRGWLESHNVCLHPDFEMFLLFGFVGQTCFLCLLLQSSFWNWRGERGRVASTFLFYRSVTVLDTSELGSGNYGVFWIVLSKAERKIWEFGVW